MQEFVKRLNIFNDAIKPFTQDGVIAIANCELAALQLRKMYELVGFASLSANRHRYAALRKRYEKDWNLAEILSRIERENPAFLPIGLEEFYSAGTPDDPHVIRASGLRLEKAVLLANHGRVARLLHARNPYSQPIDYEECHRWLFASARDLVELMDLHAVVVEYQRTIYRVTLRDAETNDVRVVIMNFEPGRMN